MENGKKYNIGLDLGVASVGWCVTDENNNILKKGKRNMWGTNLFDEAKTAKDTRVFRSSRRRLNRRRERINILQSLFIDEMEKSFPNFFPMLRESYLDKEDKKISEIIENKKYNLFSELNMTDCDYYNKYPTIYHLRNELVKSKEKVDIRLVYLAIHHIIKYRGNFLHDGDFSTNTSEVSEKLKIVLDFMEKEYEITLIENSSNFFEIIKNKNSAKSKKKEELMKYFEYDKSDKGVVENIINAILGYSFDINKIFNTDFEKNKYSFSKEIEDEDLLISQIGENEEIYISLKELYSWYILQDILTGFNYISEAFIEKYKKYADDLRLLKKVYKTYLPEKYNDMFRKNKENNYYAYNGKKTHKCTIDELYKTIKTDINSISDDVIEKKLILEDISEEFFLRKLNTTDNAAIPYQLHLLELKEILDNQSKYYDCIRENKKKIIDLFKFRIPYYVGPLSKGTNSKWGWVIRKNDDKIRPWNFSDVVDEDSTAEEFIKRMTNKCTYLFGEDVMPKNSLLYSEFCVLNELNNIRYLEKDVSRHLAKDTKNKIIEKLFKNYKKVTAERIINLLKEDGIQADTIIGLSDNKNFNASMSSFIDMEKIFGHVDESNYEMCEKIIYWNTIFEEKKILKRKIKNSFKEITDEQLNKICKLNYSGWSRLSRKLINGIKSMDNSETIMEKLRKTKYNFMQIINIEEFGFGKQIDEFMPQNNEKVTYNDIDEIPTSPANKRAIWQAILVVKDIKKVMKSEPQNIYIEFAREDGEKSLKDKRAKKLLTLYENFNYQIEQMDSKVYKELKNHQNDKNISEKLLLYFLQNGKCMYSGETLDIDNLSNYEVDHIIPQFYRKDDSIDNKVLVIKKENQKKSDSLLLSDSVILKMRPYWEFLLKNGLISEIKFKKLTRTKLFETEEDANKFAQRQLVETRQITKYVTNLLKKSLHTTDIFAIRAENTSYFRNKFALYKNRNLNDCHHAQDAYILCVIGNCLNKEWHGLTQFQYGKYVRNHIKDNYEKKDNDKNKYGIVVEFVSKRIDVSKIKNVWNYKDYYITRKLIEETGAFYNQTLYSPNDKTKPVIRLKENLDSQKYGGYSGEQKAFYSIIEYLNSKGCIEYQLVGIPIKYAYDIKNKKESLENVISKLYLKDDEKLVRITKEKILKYQEYLDENNEPMILVSDSEIKANKQLILDYETNKLIYLMNKDNKKIADDEKKDIELSYEKVYDILIEKMKKEYKCLSSATEKLIKSKEKFMELKSEDKLKVINGILDVIRKSRGNLKVLGQGDSVGRMTGKSFKNEKLMKMTFVCKSVTGMFEERYKINGMENSSNN